MRTVLLGNNQASIHALEELLSARHEVICVVPFHHKVHAWHASLFDAARERGVPSIYNPQDVNDAFFLQQLERFGPDLLLSVYYDQRLGKRLLALPRLGAFNLHPSLLPRHRGVAPLIWAIVEGDEEAGVTLHEMVLELDRGDIVFQESFRIDPGDTGFTLHQKAARVGRDLIRRFVRDPEAAIAAKRPQRGESSYHSRKDEPVNGIEWSDPARRIHDIVRALTDPLPAAFTYVDGRQVFLLETRRVPGVSQRPPGEPWFAGDGSLRVGTGDGVLALERVRVSGIELEPARDRDALEKLLHGRSFGGRQEPPPEPPPARLDRYVYFGAPVLGSEEETEVIETLRSGWIGMGAKTIALERAFEEWLGVRCLSFNSCTSALYLALESLRLEPGQEIVTSPLTFAATANVVELLGARTVFADIDPHTLNLDPKAVEAKLTSRTRALLPVHFGGLPCDMAALGAIAREHGLAIVEDAAHALGATLDGKRVGSLGNPTAFSFYANKNITTAEGGMLAGIPEAVVERLKRLRLHGLSTDAHRRFESRTLILSQLIEPGYKMNLTDLQAALGLAQFRKLPQFLARRESLARIYDQHFRGSDLVDLQARPLEGGLDRHALHLYVLRLRLERLRLPRNEIVQLLRERNVGAGIHYEALFFHPYFRERYGYRAEDFPHASRASRSVLSLPLSPSLTDGQAQAIADTVTDVLAWCAS